MDHQHVLLGISYQFFLPEMNWHVPAVMDLATTSH